MIYVGRPVREISVHGHSVEDNHPADENSAGPLKPPGKLSPAKEISLHSSGSQPQQDGIDKGLQLPGDRKMEGENRKARPCQAAGRTGKASQAYHRADAAEQNIEKQKTGDYRNNRPFYILHVRPEKFCAGSDISHHIFYSITFFGHFSAHFPQFVHLEGSM